VVVKSDCLDLVLREPNGPGIEELRGWLENRPTFYVDFPKTPTRPTLHRCDQLMKVSCMFVKDEISKGKG
jgi:hypothetical protein